MKLREILNRAEGIIITAKSFNANNNMSAVRSQMEKLHDLMHEGAWVHEDPPAGNVEQPAGNVEQPAAGKTSKPDKSQTRDGSGVSEQKIIDM